MNTDISEKIKRRARELIATVKPPPLLISILWFLINTVTGLLIMFLSGYYDFALEMSDAIASGSIYEFDMLASITRNSQTGGMVLSAILMALTAIIEVGFKWCCLRVARGETPDFKSLFDGFSRTARIIWLQIVKWTLIAVQMCFFIVPGILALIRYSQAEYIYYDHPEYGALRCLRESAKLINGQKLTFAMFALTFAGWVVCGFFIEVFVQIPVLDIWLCIYWGIAAALFHVRLRAQSITHENLL